MRYGIWPLVVILALTAVGCGEQKPTGPDGATDTVKYVSFMVALHDDHGRPVSNATLSTLPGSAVLTTDSTGVATFDSLRSDTTSLIVRREYYPNHDETITAETIDAGYVSLVLTTGGPIITILSPAEGAVLDDTVIRFTAEAIDPEDGALDKELVWSSDINGVFGHGNEISAGGFNAGVHVISCRAIDKDGNADSTSVSIDVGSDQGGGIITYFPLTVTLHDDHGRPVPGATVSSVPANVQATSDADGVVTFDNLRGDTTALLVSRQYYDDFTEPLSEGNIGDGTLAVTLPTRGPTITIHTPSDGAVLTGQTIRFTAEGFDPEDGELGDELVWSSDIDGEFGSGTEVIAEGLTEGGHLITCAAVDSDGNAGSASRSITVEVHEQVVYRPLTVTLRDDHGRPVANADVVAYPEIIQVASDNTGVAVFDSLASTMTSLHILRDYYDDVIEELTPEILESGALTVTLPTGGPIVSIIAPDDGGTMTEQVITFSATAFDPEDGDLGGELAWSSDIDGPFGAGGELMIGGLSVGQHRITCTAIDSDGNTGEATITLTVGYPPEGGIREYLPLTVTLRNDHGNPVPDATVTALPDETQLTADAGGIARFDLVSEDTASLVVTREHYEDHIEPVTREMLDSGEIAITLPTVGPEVAIFTPSEGTVVVAGSDVSFSAQGFDPDDGALDGEITWSSDLEGELGTGAEIVRGMIRVGTQVITCEATDSDGNTASASVTITVAEQTDSPSYFPMAASSWWQYRHPTITYFVTRDDGLVEDWTLGNLRVDIDASGRRSMALDIRYTLRSIRKYYTYEVVDQLKLDNQSLYVTGTTESIILRENSIDNPVFYSADVTTDYTPDYLLIPYVKNPMVLPEYDSTVWVDMSWKYKAPFDPELLYTESYSIDTSVSVGNPEYVSTPYLNINAVPVTFTQGDAYKKWWLVPGIGILKMEYTSYTIPTTAELEFSSIPQSAAQQPPAKLPAAEKPITTALPAPPSQSTAVSADTEVPPMLPEFQRLREVARAFLPR